MLECNPFYMTAGDTDATEIIVKRLLKEFNERISDLYRVLYPQQSLKRVVKLGLGNYQDFMIWFMDTVHNPWATHVEDERKKREVLA